VPEKHLETAFGNNPDGAGIMLVKNKRVQIVKGFMEFNDFINCYEKIVSKKEAMVLHFRSATHGDICPENCHPFPLSESVKDLCATQIETPVGVCHNGVINIDSGVGCRLSDTQEFIRRIMAHIDLTNPKIIELLGYVGGRFLILLGSGQVYTTGFWEKNRGIYYSNDGYKPRPWSLKYSWEKNIKEYTHFFR